VLNRIALHIAAKVNVPFISIDIAETKNEGWKVIEIGDGQFSDIRNISPLKFWSFIRESV
jgi:glutathione synthase/RimK-type ligase-like ATP-grasp enzyme